MCVVYIAFQNCMLSSFHRRPGVLSGLRYLCTRAEFSEQNWKIVWTKLTNPGKGSAGIGLPALPWNLAFDVINTPSWVNISSAKICPTSCELVSTKAKNRCKSCLTSGEGWEIGHIIEFLESKKALYSNVETVSLRRKSGWAKIDLLNTLLSSAPSRPNCFPFHEWNYND